MSVIKDLLDGLPVGDTDVLAECVGPFWTVVLTVRGAGMDSAQRDAMLRRAAALSQGWRSGGV